jgi:hypothetical protein
MVINTHERSVRNSSELPAKKLAGETGELGLLQVQRKDLACKALLVHDGEGFATRQPLDDIRML